MNYTGITNMEIQFLNRLLMFLIIGVSLTLGFAKVYFSSNAPRSIGLAMFLSVPAVLALLMGVMFIAGPIDSDSIQVFALVGVILYSLWIYGFRHSILPQASVLKLSYVLISVIIALLFEFTFSSITLAFAICGLIFLYNLTTSRTSSALIYFSYLLINIFAVILLGSSTFGNFDSILSQTSPLAFRQFAAIFLVCLMIPVHGISLAYLFHSAKWKGENSEDYTKRMQPEKKFIASEKIIANNFGFKELGFLTLIIIFQLAAIVVLNLNPILSLAYSLTLSEFLLSLPSVQNFFRGQNTN